MKNQGKFAITTVIPGSGELNLHKEFKRLIQKAIETSKNLDIAAEKLGISSRSLTKNLPYFGLAPNPIKNEKLGRLKGELLSLKIKFETVNDYSIWFFVKECRFDVSKPSNTNALVVVINNVREPSRKSLSELLIIINNKLK